MKSFAVQMNRRKRSTDFSDVKYIIKAYILLLKFSIIVIYFKLIPMTVLI